MSIEAGERELESSPASPFRPGTPGLLARLPAFALLLALGSCAAIFALDGWSAISFPYPLDYGEGPLLDQALRLSRFENIYRADLDTPPHTVANYPPLYLVAQVPWVRWLGPSYVYGRLLSWLSAVAAAVLITLLLRRLTVEWSASVVGGLTLLSIPYVACWAPLFRVDMLALALSLGGLYVTVRAGGRRGEVLAAVLLTAAIFTRQSYALAAPLAAGVWLATSGADGYRRLLRLAALVGALTVTALVALHQLSGGGFLFHVVTANANELRFDRLARHAAELGRLVPGLLAIAVLFVVGASRSRGPAFRLLVPYLAGAALAGATIAKVGSNVNYLLELSAALSLIAGASVSWLRSRPVLRGAVLLALAAQALLLLPGSRYQQHLRWKIGQREAQAELARLVREAEGPVLADEDLGLLPLAGRAVHFQPFEMTQLAREGLWDPGPVLQALERQEFALILIHRVPWSPIHETRWTPAMLERVARHYVRRGSVGYTIVYGPRAPAPA